MNMNRDEELCGKFNQYFERFGLNDFYSRLSSKDLIDLKKLLSCINNIITLRTTDAFVMKIYEDKFITLDEKEKIMLNVLDQHANTNGYDIRFDDNIDKKIIAEVKCNIPVYKSSFGAAQEEGILEDIHHLLTGKKKENISDVSDYFKFMVILDCERAQVSMEKIINKTEHVKRYTTPAELDTNNVFVIYV